MKISEAHAIQEILLTCDMLEAEEMEVTVESVWKRLVRETGYEYPRNVLAQTLQERNSYVYNVKVHGFEKVHA